MHRLALTTTLCLTAGGALELGCASARLFTGQVDPARPSPAGNEAQPPSSSRAPSSPVVDLLGPKRPRVSDAQLEKLRELPLEACWAALQGHGYRQSFEGGFLVTQPAKKVAGRVVTLRYLPVRPDLVEAVRELAKRGGWNPAFNIRAGDVVERGDVVCVELGGMVERATFVGDITALAIQERGAEALVVDGGIRDYSEVRQLELPCYVRGVHASAMESQIGVEWGVPVRIGGITVLPGDAILGDASGVLAIPPELVDPVIEKARATAEKEEFIREKLRTKKYRASDLYPDPIPDLLKELEARRAARAGRGGPPATGEKVEKKEK